LFLSISWNNPPRDGAAPPGTPRSSAFDAASKREHPEDAAEQFACAVNLN
jgi:hypothetical protein